MMGMREAQGDLFRADSLHLDYVGRDSFHAWLATEGRRLLAASYAYLGDMEKARFEAGKVMEAFPNFSLDHWIKVLPDKDSAETEHFVEGLRRAGLK